MDGPQLRRNAGQRRSLRTALRQVAEDVLAAHQADAFDANWLLASPPDSKSGLWALAGAQGRSLARASVGFLGAAAPMLGRWRVPAVAPPRVLAFYDTYNQRSVLAAVARNAPQFLLLGSMKSAADAVFPDGLAYCSAIGFVGKASLELLHSDGHRRVFARSCFDLLVASHGYFLAATHLLRRLAPRLVLVANDHTMRARSLCAAARRLGIPTAYVQHAAVTERFPRLEFDYAFLQGEDALDKYLMRGIPRTTIFLSGSPSLMPPPERPLVRQDRLVIGIATNILDDGPGLRRAIRLVQREFPDASLLVRPHPGDARTEMRPRGPRIRLSLHDAQSSASFAGAIDVLIAGDTSLHLEAAARGTPSVGAPLRSGAGQLIDWYGFIARGMVISCASIDAMPAAVRGALARPPSEVRDRARYFLADIGTDHEGRVGQTVAETLLALSEDARVQDLSTWKRWNGTPGASRVFRYAPRA